MHLIPLPAKYLPELMAALERVRQSVECDQAMDGRYIEPDRRDDRRTGTVYVAVIEMDDTMRDIPVADIPRRALAASA